MKNNRKHSLEMKFMRGRVITPSLASLDQRRVLKRPFSAKLGVEMRNCGPDGNGDNHSKATAIPELDTAALLSPPHSLLGYKPPQVEHPKLKIVILGLSITSAWGNGHATTYRGLVRELTKRVHDVVFLERDTECYASNRDLPNPPYGRTELYSSVKELKQRFSAVVRDADFVIVGSHVQEGIAIGEWVTRVARGATAFYDIDTPVTVANLIRGDADYISSELIPRYQIYLSFTGGPLLRYIEKHYGSPMARPLYCSVDATLYFPEEHALKWDLGYVGTYSGDRQRALDRLLLEPARHWGEGRFVVAGPQYPRTVLWPHNVKRLTHLAPEKHRAFYNSQRFTLNVTRANMIAAGFSPSVRLFEAAACGTPIISDFWQGIETFFKPEEEILISHSADETLIYLEEISELDRRRIGYRARERVLAKHTSRHRALELENYAFEILKPSAT
jgi:spore maturation protein CgeB